MAKLDEYVGEMSADEYLEKHHVLQYVEDAISQLLEYKDNYPKVVHTKFLSDYFRSVHRGMHTLFRDYSYVCFSSHNRSSFIKSIWSSFRHIASHGELLSVKEYHSLLQLLCYDFPMEMVQRTARIVLMDDALDCLMSFTDFLYAFQIQFYYEDFIDACKELYGYLLTGATTVFVPSSENWQPTHSIDVRSDEDAKLNEGVNSRSFYEAIEKACTKLSSNTAKPSLQNIQSELSRVRRVTFYGFLMSLCKNDDVNQKIGVLPDRDNLLDGSDADIILKTS